MTMARGHECREGAWCQPNRLPATVDVKGYEIEGHTRICDPAPEGTAQYPRSGGSRDANGFSWDGSCWCEAEPFEVLAIAHDGTTTVFPRYWP